MHSAEWAPSQTMAQMTMRVTAGSRARRGMLEAVPGAHAVVIGTAASTLHRNGLSCLRSRICTSAVPARRHCCLKTLIAVSYTFFPGLDTQLAIVGLLYRYICNVAQIALITGGDSGIGRSAAFMFAKEGADLAIHYLNEDRDAEVHSNCRKKTHAAHNPNQLVASLSLCSAHGVAVLVAVWHSQHGCSLPQADIACRRPILPAGVLCLGLLDGPACLAPGSGPGMLSTWRRTSSRSLRRRAACASSSAATCRRRHTPKDLLLRAISRLRTIYCSRTRRRSSRRRAASASSSAATWTMRRCAWRW